MVDNFVDHIYCVKCPRKFGNSLKELAIVISAGYKRVINY